MFKTTEIECLRCKWAGRPKSFLRVRKVYIDGSRSADCENLNCNELTILPPENKKEDKLLASQTGVGIV